jgi:1-acyl-sn-glycerol-3-phosphate acyltransferase
VQPSAPLAAVRSALIWFAIGLLILLWLPLLALIALFDRDPVRYTTGRWFRRLGVAMTKVNPAWRLTFGGFRPENPRTPYMVVSNHQSMADIPLISHVPWEMKWVGKEELFKLPVIGLMMRFARDIPVDRSDRRSGARMMLRVVTTLERRCSVIMFPEGTRSTDGRIGKFNDGAFQLAVKAGVPVLPIVVEGSHGCLPKRSWIFGPVNIRLEVLPPVPCGSDPMVLRDTVRSMIVAKLAEWRNVPAGDVDALTPERGRA